MLFIFRLFFFKQKTAYEMRISDWSSDVCSSDLCDGEWRRGGRALFRGQDLRRGDRAPRRQGWEGAALAQGRCRWRAEYRISRPVGKGRQTHPPIAAPSSLTGRSG